MPGLLAAALLLGLMLAAVHPAYSQQDPLRLTVESGLDGYCKENHWVPIRISVENSGEAIDAQLGVRLQRASQDEVFYGREVSLPPSSRKEFFLYIFPENFLPELKVGLWEGATLRAEALSGITCVSERDWIFGVLSDQPTNYLRLTDIQPPAGTTVMPQLSIEDLPDRPQALRGVLDALVIANVDTGVLRADQSQALAGWLSTGGRLIVVGGPDWERTAAGLREFLPLEPAGTITVENLAALSHLGEGLALLRAPTVLTSGSLQPAAEILLAQDQIPLVVRARFGAGEVIYLSFDPALQPIRDWVGLDLLYRKLLEPSLDPPSWAGGFQDWDSARNAIGLVPSAEVPPVWLICGFLLIYIAAVGPLNYYVLKRIGRKELAWYTIPGLVLLFSGLAFILGGRARGNQPVVNQLALVQVWPGLREAQVDGLVGIFSPTRARYELTVDDPFLLRPIPQGFATSEGDWTVLADADQSKVPDIRIEVGGVRGLTTSGTAPAPKFSAELEAVLTDGGILLTGRVVNDSAIPLTDVVLLAPGMVRPVGDLLPNGEIQIDLTLERAQLGNLTRPNLGYFQPEESLVEDLLGAAYFSRFDEREEFRRYSFVTALTDSFRQMGRGGGVTVAGWSDIVPISSGLVQADFETSSLGLYLIQLGPPPLPRDEKIVIPPAAMIWGIIEASAPGRIGPYDSVLDGGTFSLKFAPSQPLFFTQVDELTFHLQGFGESGAAPMLISLWDFAEQRWVELADPGWGENPIAEPARFVSGFGEIRLRLESLGSGQAANIEAADFTLIVSP